MPHKPLEEQIEAEKLQDEFMEFWDSQKANLGLGNYSDEITRFWLNKIDLVTKETEKRVIEKAINIVKECTALDEDRGSYILEKLTTLK